MTDGLLVIISSPSGGGKNAIVAQIVKKLPRTTRLVATTTRNPRKKERNGRDYHFITKQKFEDLLKNNKFLEYNFYADDYYGIEKDRFLKDLQDFKITIATIDVNGKMTFDKLKIPHLSIFLLPESLDSLAERIQRRGGVSKEQLQKRLDTAKKELKEAKKYDYQVINHDGKMGKTVDKTIEIIKKALETLDKKQHLR